MARRAATSPRSGKTRSAVRSARRPRASANSSGSGSSRGSIGLREAVLSALDPSEKAEFLSLEGEAYMIYALLSPGPRGRRYLELCDRGWARFMPHLAGGTFIARGRNAADPFSPLQVIPGDRWRYARVDYEKWTVRMGQATIIEVEILRTPALFISEKTQQVLFGSVDLQLRGNLFNVLLTIAEVAKAGDTDGLVTFDELKKKRYASNVSQQRIAQDVAKIKRKMEDRGIDRDSVEAALRSEPNVGYRLTIPTAGITIERKP
jgi:hypothetical protein